MTELSIEHLVLDLDRITVLNTLPVMYAAMFRAGGRVTSIETSSLDRSDYQPPGPPIFRITLRGKDDK